MKVRAVGNRLSFPICTSTQRKSECITEMVSVCLKLDNKWTDLHACSRDGHRSKCRRNTRKKTSLTARSRMGLIEREKKPATKQNFKPGNAETVVVFLLFLPEHVKERGVINFHRIRLPGENDCFSLYLVTIFQFPVVFVTLNIFANEQNRGKRRRCSANFTLGPSVICIYIESIRFWFIIVTILGWGRGAGGGWQAFCHLL